MSWHPSDLLWTKMVDQTLTLPERVRLNWHLRGCERCRLQNSALLNERAAFAVDQEEISAISARVIQRESPRPQFWSWWRTRVALGFAVSAAIALLVVAIVPRGDDTLSIKGGDSFELLLKRGSDVSPLGARCLPGDALRARVRSARGYVLVVGVDATGKVSPLFPFDGVASGPVPGDEFIPGSWVLDEVPGRERFVAIFSDAPIEFSRVNEALSKASSTIAGAVLIERSCIKAGP